MPDYYVNTAVGDDLNDGSEANPWRRLRRAVLAASAADTIHVDAENHLTAVRQTVTIDRDIIIKPTNGNDNFYVTPSFPLAQGEIFEDLDREDFFQEYTGATPATTTKWTRYIGTTSSLDSSTNLIGAGCLLMDGATARQGVRKNYGHVDGKPIRFRIVYKCAPGATFRLTIRGSADAYNFNVSTGAWVAGVYNNDYTDAEWTELVTPWIDGLTTSNYVQLDSVAGGGEVRIQMFLQEQMASWAIDTGNVRVIEYVRPSASGEFEVITSAVGPYSSLPFLMKCSESEWQSNGPSALRMVPTAASYAALAAGEYFYDHSALKLYYMPESGESFDGIHFEVHRGGTALSLTSTCACVAPYVFAANNGYYSAGSAAPVLYNPIEESTTYLGFRAKGTSHLLAYNPISRQPMRASAVKEHGGGYFNNETSIMTLYGAYCLNAGDDSYQSAESGQLNIYGCVSINAAGGDIELINNANATHNIYAFSGNFGGETSFMDQSMAGTITVNMDNCAFGHVQFLNAVTRNYTVGTAVFCGRAAPGTSGGATVPAAISSNVNFSATLGFTSAADLTPTPASDLYMSGVKWWSGINPVSASGEPYPDFDIDAGGLQSTHGPFHPSNLG